MKTTAIPVASQIFCQSPAIGVVFGTIHAKISYMYLRAVSLLLLPTLAAFAYNPGRPAPEPFVFERSAPYFSACTPLTEIPVYQLEPTAESGADATKALQVELDRLYTHAKTLPSGHDRRSFETRIYLLEKRLRPLATNFDLATWTSLRADVRSEWVAVQATLPAAPVNVAST